VAVLPLLSTAVQPSGSNRNRRSTPRTTPQVRSSGAKSVSYHEIIVLAARLRAQDGQIFRALAFLAIRPCSDMRIATDSFRSASETGREQMSQAVGMWSWSTEYA
jgi:hypothetical protein